MQKTIYIGSDHAGFELKEKIKDFLKNKEINLKDVGPKEYRENDDYPDYAIPLAQKVTNSENARGILICGNGVGVCMAANKVKGIRAGTACNSWMAKTMREDDNTNVICLPAQDLEQKEATDIIETWLKTSFSYAERHKRRLKKINEFE